MDAEQVPAEDLVGLHQVVQVGPGVGLAGGTGAAGLERGIGKLVHRAADLQPAGAGEGDAALRQLRGDDAVEHVHPAVHGLEEVGRRADAHQVARQQAGQLGGHGAGELVALGGRLADRETADGHAVERQAAEEVRALPAEVMVTRALHDAEQRLRRVAPGLQGPLRPAVRERHGRGRLGVRRGGRDALVERHHDVAADRLLHREARLGREQVLLAVDVAAEARARLVHGAVSRHREDLESARVGQHRPVPAHEPVDAAELPEHLGPGPQHQVVGVGQQHGGAGGLQRLDGLALHRRLRAHRHEHGCLHRAVQRVERRRARLRAGGLGLEGEVESRHAGTGPSALSGRGAPAPSGRSRRW